MLLFVDGVLSNPLLYLSLFLRQHRGEYYSSLDRVRREGDWEAWLDFFLQGVIETANSAFEIAQRLVSMFAVDQERIQTCGRSASSMIRVHQVLKERVIVTATAVCETTGLSFPAVSSALRRLSDLEIVHEVTGRRRNRVFVYHEYLAVLNEGGRVWLLAEPRGWVGVAGGSLMGSSEGGVALCWRQLDSGAVPGSVAAGAVSTLAGVGRAGRAWRRRGR